MKRLLLILIGVCLTAAVVVAQASPFNIRPLRLRVHGGPTLDASGIAASRKIDWTGAGATITNRAVQCGSTIAAYTGTAATINTAIANCTAGQFVQLGTGTFALSTAIEFAGKSNVTLRGNGPNLTIISSTAQPGGCGGIFGVICVDSATLNSIYGLQNTANWTAGYAKDSTSITLDAATNLAVGSQVVLDQNNDTNTDNGAVWMNETINVSSSEGGQAGRLGRAQSQIVRVTSVTGSGPYTVVISPGLYMPNWRSGQDPEAWWADGLPIVGVGVENLKIDVGYTCTGPGDLRGGLAFYNARGSWAKNISVHFACRAHVMLFQSDHNTIRDSYFYDSQNHASQSYGIEYSIGSDNLIENNIMHHVTAPFQSGGSGTGNVFAYNYTFDDYYTASPTFMQFSQYSHTAGVNFVLYEGNDGTGMAADGVHGTQHFLTAFRNRFAGWETGKTTFTHAVAVAAFTRYVNLVGNVLGTDAYHTDYLAGPAESIYNLGYSPGGSVPADTLVATTILRWNNYDVATDTTRAESSEVPSGLALYPNPVPVGGLTASLHLAAQPAWWATTWGTPPWPAIGGDVSGGNGPGGKSYDIPAKLCYNNSAKDGDGQLTAFNAGGCYGS